MDAHTDSEKLDVLLHCPREADDQNRTKEQLLKELAELRRRNAQLQRQTEEALREANSRLESVRAELVRVLQESVRRERMRTVGEMASGIAHDFNNMLTLILGFSDLLLKNPEQLDDRAKVERYLEQIRRAARDAAEVVNRLNEFHCPWREGEGFSPMNINALVEHALIRTRPRWKDQAQSMGIQIRIETDLREIPLVSGRGSELMSVLDNLIFNAVDAMPGGGTITMRTRVEDVGEAEDSRWAEEVGGGEKGVSLDKTERPDRPSPPVGHVVLELSDTGAGMSEEVHEHCLEPFFTTKDEGGSGLGLAMAYGIIRRHQGRIDVETAEGEGTTFILRLPVGTDGELEWTEPDVEVPGPPLKILVVDDEPLIVEILSAFLGNDGHRVEAAADGVEALNCFRAGGFDLVITDRCMPEMNGEQLAAAVKKIEPSVPVILLTGFGEEMRAKGEAPECIDALLSKPPTLGRLRNGILEATARKLHN